MGFNERSPHSLGCIWNSAILINDEGRIVNHQRKLMPTWFEKLVWAPGDGKGLKVVDTGRCGKVGALLCGESKYYLCFGALQPLPLTYWRL